MKYKDIGKFQNLPKEIKIRSILDFLTVGFDGKIVLRNILKYLNKSTLNYNFNQPDYLNVRHMQLHFPAFLGVVLPSLYIWPRKIGPTMLLLGLQQKYVSLLYPCVEIEY